MLFITSKSLTKNIQVLTWFVMTIIKSQNNTYVDPHLTDTKVRDASCMIGKKIRMKTTRKKENLFIGSKSKIKISFTDSILVPVITWTEGLLRSNCLMKI